MNFAPVRSIVDHPLWDMIRPLVYWQAGDQKANGKRIEVVRTVTEQQSQFLLGISKLCINDKCKERMAPFRQRSSWNNLYYRASCGAVCWKSAQRLSSAEYACIARRVGTDAGHNPLQGDLFS